MKTSFLASFFVLSLALSHAQTITWGDPIPVIKGHKPAGFVGNKTIGYVQFSEDFGKSIGLNKISADLKTGGSDVREISNIKKATLDGVIELGDKAYAMIAGFNKETGSDYLLAQEVDIKSGKFVGEPKELVTPPGELMGSMEMIAGIGYRMTERFKFVMSDDHDKVLVYYEMRPTKTDKSQAYTYILFDKNLKEIWSYKQEAYPRLGGKGVFIVNNAIFDIAYEKGGLKLLKYDGDNKIESTDIPLGNIFLQNVNWEKLDNNKVIVSGYYSSLASSTNTTGYFTTALDLNDNSIGELNKYAFKDELINAFESDRTKRKLEKAEEKGAGPGIPNLELRRIIKKSDGGYYVIGEQYSYKVVTTDNGVKTYNNYHDVIISSIDANGQELATVKIPKQQQFVNNHYGSGLGCFLQSDNLYMFYLDNVVNKNLAEGGVPVEFRDFREGAFMCVKMSPSGTITKTALFDMKDENKTILPDGIDEIESGLLLSSGKRSQIISGKVNTPAMIKLN